MRQTLALIGWGKLGTGEVNVFKGEGWRGQRDREKDSAVTRYGESGFLKNGFELFIATDIAAPRDITIYAYLDKTTGIPYIMISFEWDDAKAVANLRLHGVSFEDGARAFTDPFAIEWIDDRQIYGEERFVLLGFCGYEVLYVAYTERGDNIRIISVRKATKNEKDHYYRQNAP
ncbi:MAG: hypothetical protein A4E57_04909 [Syntrophorhabdaceae bacterium PtaU1.Bin034]|nr:MAG: hypothetical protein A4E57_04909 [Syntrophorhabdaceae bacterium PtaU1.Bin034]